MMVGVLRPPELQGVSNRINMPLSPPLLLIPRPMQFGVMFDTERDSPLVTDLTTQGARLGKADMVGLTGALPTNEAGKGGDIPPVLLIPSANWRAEGERRLIDASLFMRALLVPIRTGSILPRWSWARLGGTVGIRFGGWFLGILEIFEPPPIDQDQKIAVVLVAVAHEVGEVLF